MPKRSVQTILLALAALLAVLAVWLLVTSPSAVTQREAERVAVRQAERGAQYRTSFRGAERGADPAPGGDRGAYARPQRGAKQHAE